MPDRECLAIEFGDQQIPFQVRPRVRLEYKGHVLTQEYEPDFLCFGKIIVEIKAVKAPAGEHRAQTINYLKATGHELGLLINFGCHSGLEHERFVNQPYSRDSRDS